MSVHVGQGMWMSGATAGPDYTELETVTTNYRMAAEDLGLPDDQEG